jgi:hypothetical protein
MVLIYNNHPTSRNIYIPKIKNITITEKDLKNKNITLYENLLYSE